MIMFSVIDSVNDSEVFITVSGEYLLLHGEQFSCSILCNFYLVSLIRFSALVAT